MGTAIVVICIILGIIGIGFLGKVEIGYLSVLAALLCGLLFTGLSITQIVSLIPLNTIFTIILITTFFGYAVENGTIQLLISKILTLFADKMALFPPFVFVLALVASGSGLGGGNATLLLAPIAFLIGIPAGITPLVLGMAVSCGATAGSNFPFSYGGVIFSSLVEAQKYPESVSTLVSSAAITGVILSVLSFLAVFFVIRDRVAKHHHIGPDCATLNSCQKRTLVLTCCVVALVVIPNVANLFFPRSFWGTAVRFCDIRVVMAAGIVLANLLRLADDRTILRDHIPWRIIVLISGMSMLIGVAGTMGVANALSQILCRYLSNNTIVYSVIIVSMVMSLFSSAIAIVLPSLLPMVTVLSLATGLDTGLLYTAVFLGATCGGISPLSTGGMIVLANSTLEGKPRAKLFNQLLLMPFLQALICCIIFFTRSLLS